MNTSHIAKYAPKARTDFIAAMTKQAAKYGITENDVSFLEIRGDVALISERPFPASIAKSREALAQRVGQVGFNQAMEQAAYGWFNRLCAIRYKNWLFSSGKRKASQCLVYLHRYIEGTLARMRTEYVIPLTSKLSSHVENLEQDKDASDVTAEIKRLRKQIDILHKQQVELSAFDEKLRHYADHRIRLDLDDGVKVSYGKFGDLLANVKAITGKNPV